MSDDRLETELIECLDNAVLLDESSYSTDIHEYVKQLVRQGVDSKEWRFWIIQWVAESLNPAMKKVRKKAAIEYLDTPQRTFERWLNTHLNFGSEAIPRSSRGKKGKHALTQEWEKFITDTWKKGSKGKRIMSSVAIYDMVECEASKRKADEYPSYWTVRRILQPLIEQRQTRNGISSAGQGMESSLPTRAGEVLKANYSNKVVEIDHTKVDAFSQLINGSNRISIMEVEDGSIPPLEGAIRLYLSVLKDVFSKCILGHLLSIKQPSSEDVAQLIRRAILPKELPSDYDLQDVKIPYGGFSHLYVDGGNDLKSEHIKQIGSYLKRLSPGMGFEVHLRRMPSDGGDVESVFNGLNKKVWSLDPSYTGSNTTQRPKDAQTKACLTPRDTDKLLSWYFYGEYNNDLHTKDPTETRYTKWLEGMNSELPPIIDERKLDAYLRKIQTAKVYRHGRVRFKNRRYQGESLKAFAGSSITLRYESSNILRLAAYELETDEKPGRFLGYAEMQDIQEINYWITKLELPVREIDLTNLKSETFSLEELEEVNAAVNVRGKELKDKTKPIRIKYRGKRYDVVEQKSRKAHKRKKQSRSNNKKSSQSITQASHAATEALSPPITAISAENTIGSAIAAQKDDIASAPPIVGVPEPRKIVSMQEKLHEKSIESFKEQLKAAETNRPKLVVSRRKGRSR